MVITCPLNTHTQHSGTGDAMHTPPDTAPAPLLYADPNSIRRDEHPMTGDVYIVPDKSRKRHKPEDHLPTYQVMMT